MGSYLSTPCVISFAKKQTKAAIGTGEAGWIDGDWKKAQFREPQGMAFARDRQLLYVADTGNHLLRLID